LQIIELSLSTDSLQLIPSTWFTHFGVFGERTQMSWNERKPMDERLCFIARLKEGETMSLSSASQAYSRKANCPMRQTDSIA
jgi:hypothetical protein